MKGIVPNEEEIRINGVRSEIIDVIIPAFNEESAIADVINDIPKAYVRHIIVADNGSKDNTAKIAEQAGAIVVHEPNPGYGAACLKGIAFLNQLDVPPDIVVFIDGDYSDYPEKLPSLVQPIIGGEASLVIGSRALGNAQKGSMTPVQIFGNWLATHLIRLIYKYNFTDLGPFRAIVYDTLIQLDMRDRDFGWTVEMQVKAAKLKIPSVEIPVDYRIRIGVSKVSGTIKGSVLAGHKILWTIFKLI